MTFFWKHKIFTLFLGFLVFYFFYNPAKKFGYMQSGLIIYNKVPVTFLDLYVDTTGSMALEQDFSRKQSFDYWYKTFIEEKKIFPPRKMYVGMGFGKSRTMKFNEEQIAKIGSWGWEIEITDTKNAARLYNAERDSGHMPAIILHTK